MGKTIHTLVKDVYDLFNPEVHVEIQPEHLETFATNLKNKLIEKLGKSTYVPRLRMSNLGTPCARQLWYSVNKPEQGERLQPSTYIKFLFGDVIEELLLFLAKCAGHSISDEQRELEINGVKGRCDATIDGTLVDVKSASSRSFDKFEKGLKREDDGFGYLTQLGLYNHAIGTRDKESAFIAFDKQMGTIAVDIHEPDDSMDYPKLVEERKNVVSAPEPPPRGFDDKPEGASGNRSLVFNCSYCSFKSTCWPGLEAYAYSRGPVYLTKTVRVPDVPRIY